VLEDSIKYFLEVEAEELRQECVAVLKKDKPPKSNINEDESRALKNLHTNKDIMVMKVYKGNVTIIMDLMTIIIK
jgi:hypothetical protein